MNREALLDELNGLLDAGEPLLTAFPPKNPSYGWWLLLPDSISDEMRWYADSVALRTWDRKKYQDYRQQDSTAYLTQLVERNKSGLLGWRAIGVLS